MHGTHLLYIFVILSGYATCKSFHKREINRDTKVDVIGPVVEPHRVHLYRHLVEVRYRCNHICGGVIISARHVLTAAHCVVEKDHQELTITAGITKRFEGNGDIRDVFAALIHGGYNRTQLVNDIALLILQNPLDVTKYTVAKLPEVRDDFEESVVDIAGWGGTDNLTYGYFTVRNHISCRVPTRLCIIPFPGIETFKGDSGSPAVVRKGSDVTLVGIVSSYYILADVTHLRSWIDESIAEGEQLLKLSTTHLSKLPKNECAAIDEAVYKLIENANNSF